MISVFKNINRFVGKSKLLDWFAIFCAKYLLYVIIAVLFLSAVKPKTAVIEVGAKNTYGHPTPEVLQRLAKSGIKVLRTDINGDVDFVSDGNNLKLISK